MKPTGLLDWDTVQIAEALRIDEGSVREYFTDGRRVAFLIERRLRTDMDYKMTPSEGAAFDLIDPQGGKWEVRSITRASGVRFCPSSMVGTQREFDETKFLEKLDEVSGYILADIQQFPKIPYWRIPVNYVRQWWNTKQLRSRSEVNRNECLRLIRDLPESL